MKPITKFFVLLFALILTALPLCAWTPENTTLEATYQLALLIDYKTSRDIVRYSCGESNKGFYEQNPLLGRHPNQAKLNQACFLSSIGHFAISYLLPERFRLPWQGGTAGLAVGIDIHNLSIGMTCRF
jgi:hypothetical protein